MNREQMLIAVQAIHQGKDYFDSGLPLNLDYILQWHELKSEISDGYSIDFPLSHARDAA
ncbi:MAG: hypothetical protein ACO3M5_11120 [Saprospiraceae bacterium]